MSDILTNPAPGYRYKVVYGDRITWISDRAYGTEKYAKDIVSANPQLNGRVISLENLPTIYAGDILIIPDLIPKREKILSGRQDDDLTILIEDKEVKYDSAAFLRTMDTASDAVTFTIAWQPGIDKELDKQLMPFKYPKAEVFIGNNLALTGYVYIIRPSLSGRSELQLTIFTKTKDTVDSTINPPYEKNNVKLEDRAKELLNPLGISAIFDIDSGGQFERMTASYNDTIFSHLAEYASQRGILLSCTAKGELRFYKADTTAEPAGTLEEGGNFVLNFAGEYDGTKLYNTYKAIADTPGGDAQEETITDDNVPKSRMLTFKADDTTDGNIGKAAEWKRSKLYADALANNIPISGWKSPNGNIYEPAQIVILKSPTLFLPNGAKMIIRSVNFEIDATGKQCNLDVVPIQVYSGEAIEYIWSVS